MIKVNLVVPKNTFNICVTLFIGISLISRDQRKGSGAKAKPVHLKEVDKQTLVSMVEQLHQTLSVKNYTVNRGMRVLKPYLSKYKVCIPGFSKIVPYDESYLYVYCIYDTKQKPTASTVFPVRASEAIGTTTHHKRHKQTLQNLAIRKYT